MLTKKRENLQIKQKCHGKQLRILKNNSMRQAWRGKLHKSKFINRLDIDL